LKMRAEDLEEKLEELREEEVVRAYELLGRVEDMLEALAVGFGYKTKWDERAEVIREVKEKLREAFPEVEEYEKLFSEWKRLKIKEIKIPIFGVKHTAKECLKKVSKEEFINCLLDKLT